MVEVKLLAFTQVSPDIKHIVPENVSDGEYICAIAGRNTITSKTPEELLKVSSKKVKGTIKAVMNYGHYSVIEHLSFTFLVWDFSRIISQQLTRHRIASFSQRGQRYVKWEKPNFIVPPSISKNEDAKKTFDDIMKKTLDAYKDLLNKGIPAEDARFVLPNAIETYIVFTMNARELLHFFKLRLCAKAQWEIRELAFKMLKLVFPIAPTIFQYAGPSCISEGICREPSKPIAVCNEIIKNINNLKEKYKE
ncbi:MAG: FAD-dependent thymidylate synthase [Candidatus Asgardarchaeia archaeon]